jgi:hypothetical protein
MGTLLQRLDCGASYVYSPRGQQSGSRESQQRVRELKRRDARTLAFLVGEIGLMFNAVNSPRIECDSESGFAPRMSSSISLK